MFRRALRFYQEKAMRLLILTDIHANLPALRAVLATPEAAACQRVISLGDQVNFGPEPREVMRLLRDKGALMLLGNHEARLARACAPEYAGYNWSLQRWTHAQLEGISLDLPVDVREGRCLYTHGTPGDPFHLLEPADLPGLLDSLPEGVTHLFSGHNHAPWLIRHGGRTACNPGSLGLLEDGRGGTAPFAVMEEHAGSITLTRHLAPYDADETARAFLRTGCAAAAPEMSRIVLHTMRTGEYQAVLKLVRFVSSLGDVGDAAVWQEADRLWPWREGVSSAEFWHRMEASL